MIGVMFCSSIAILTRAFCGCLRVAGEVSVSAFPVPGDIL